MIRLNLLPIEQKKSLKSHFLHCNIIFSGLFMILLILISAVFLGAMLVFLNLKFYSIGKQMTIEQSRIVQIETIKELEKKIKDLNLQLLDLNEAQRSQSNFYEILSDIVPGLLSGVKVYTIEMDKDTKRISVTGHSATRENLLLIKEMLEKSAKYKNIDFPISNLTNPRNIDFRFGFTYE